MAKIKRGRACASLRRHVIGHLKPEHRVGRISRNSSEVVNANCGTHVGCARLPELSLKSS
jgi:hypothetical protein